MADTSFGELLRGYRNRAGLSQEQLAERSGLSRRGIADLERGARRAPYRHTLGQLASALELDTQDRHELFAAARAGRPHARISQRPPDLIPDPLSSFIGRQSERAELLERLANARMVTLVGTAGIGKTRLAIEITRCAAGDYSDGAAFVDLTPIVEDTQVLDAVAAAVGVPEPTRPLANTLADYLRTRHTLIVLDNCERVIQGCADFIQRVLQVCPRVRVLATSRERLGITGEITWRVPPLDVGDSAGRAPLDEIARCDAVRLFVERAAAVHPEFAIDDANGPAVAQICRRLDGLPLAIELAAARVRALTPQQIAVRLDDRFHLLVGGSRTAPERHQTLAAALHWSYALLSNRERVVFDRLAVFIGGWSLDAAEAVCADALAPSRAVLDILTQLADKSLVVVDARGANEVRYRLLETVGQFAAERLKERGELDLLRHKYASFYLSLAERSIVELHTPRHADWFTRLEIEHDNLRQALAFCIEGHQIETVVRFLAALSSFWLRRGHADEGRAWFSRAQELIDAAPASATHAAALIGGASLAYYQHDFDVARDAQQRALAESRAVGDTYGAAVALSEFGYTELSFDRAEAATALLEESLKLFRSIRDEAGVAGSLYYLGNVAASAADYGKAMRFFEEALSIGRAQGDTSRMAGALHVIGHLCLKQRELERAMDFLTEAVELSALLHQPRGTAVCLESLGVAMATRRRFDRAALLFGAAAALRSSDRAGRRPWIEVDYERSLGESRAALGEETFTRAWSAGNRLSVEDVLARIFDPSETDASNAAESPLTARETEVARLVAEGLTNRGIGDALVITEGTAALHVKHILSKLGFRSRAQIAGWVRSRETYLLSN